MKKNLFLKIILSIFILYTLVGFFVLPNIIQNQIIKNLDNLLITKTSLKKVTFNPFTLDIELNNFSLKNEDKSLLSFEKLYIDFSLLKSIHESHISFKNINLVKPYVNIIQNEKGNINFTSLLKKEDKDITTKKGNEDSSIPNFKITKTEIIDGNFIFTQIFNGKNTSTNINNFNYTFYEIGTFKNSLASHNLETFINKNTKLYIKGGFRLFPFKMYGKVKLDNFKTKEYFAYSKDLLNFDISNTNINLTFGYKIDTTKDLLLYIDDTNLDLQDFKLIKEEKELLSFKNFAINKLNLDLAKQRVDIDTISLNELIANIILNKNSKLNFNNLINIKEEKELIKKEETKLKPWIISLNNFSLKDSSASYNDLKNSMNIDTKNINISINNSLIIDKDIEVENLSLNNIDLKIEDKTDINIDKINLALKNISYKNNEVKIDNTKLSSKYITLEDKKDKKNISVKNFDININNLFQNEKKIKLSSIDLNEPITSIILGKKEFTNKEEIKEEKSIEKENPDNKLNLDIGPVNIKNASLSFQDKNLPIPFKTDITKLNGHISELKSDSSKPTKLQVEGKIDEYGYTRITGFVDHKNIKNLTDINMIFKNIAIKNFTPYSGKFVGRKLDAGKLNLNLKYNIKKSNLEAKNSIIITDIKLGEVVKSEGAMSLPLELGIALLEDSDGVIDLDIPITGDLNDPKFSIAPIVWKAVSNLIIKAVSAPFSFLASLLGISEDEINSAEFIYGESKLLDSEKESLDKIAKAFIKRPNIALKISGAYDKTQDTKALQYLKIENLLKEDMKKLKVKDSYLQALEKRYLSLKEKTNLDDLKKRFTLKKENKKESFDKDLYLKFLKEKIAKTLKIKEEELILLAKNRINSLNNYLLQTHSLEQNRIIIEKEIKILDNKDAKYAKFDLEIDIKK